MNARHWSSRFPGAGVNPHPHHIPFRAWIGAVIFTIVFFGIVPLVGFLAGF